MRQTQKYFFGFLLLPCLLAIAGCGVGHFDTEEDYSKNPNSINSLAGSNTPVELPKNGDFEVAKTFDKNVNEVYSLKNLQSSCLAIDLPADNHNYFLNIINRGNNSKKLSVIASGTASSRLSCRESAPDNISSLYFYDDASKLSYEARLNFIKASQAKIHSLNNSERASRNSLSDHSYEVVGQEYPIYTGSLGVKPMVTLRRCKLVAVTSHVKYFVDQENHGYTEYDPSQMEAWVTGKNGSFSLANIFDTFTYGNVSGFSVLEENFGTVADIDNDGKLSILFSPILRIWSNGLEGLFPQEVMMPDSGQYVNLPALPEYRDMIIIGPVRHISADYCKQRILSNMIHETQHAINFSNRAYSGNIYTPGYDVKCFAEELGFDEGCSVTAEALFRRAWGKAGLPTLYNCKTGGMDREFTGNDSRFNFYLRENYCISSVYPFDGSNFNYSQDYGRNGLFMLFLYDRFGKDSFKRLIQQGWQGANLVTAIPMILYGNETPFDELQRDWIFALQNEYLRTSQNEKGCFMTAGVRFKYSDWLQLSPANKSINSNFTYLSSQYGIMYILEPSATNTENSKNFRLFIKTSSDQTLEDMEINIIKLPNN